MSTAAIALMHLVHEPPSEGKATTVRKNICEVAHNTGLSQSRRPTAPARLVPFRRQLVHRCDLNLIFLISELGAIEQTGRRDWYEPLRRV